MAKQEKGGASNATRQHYRMAIGEKVTGMKHGGSVKASQGFVKGAKVRPKEKFE